MTDETPKPLHPFEYQRPRKRQLEIMMDLREQCKILHDDMLRQLPPGRCRSLAITKLEECSMWINKACVFYDWNERSMKEAYPYEYNRVGGLATIEDLP